jgi:hypothetical protein
LAVRKVPRQCPLVLLVKDLFNFEVKDVGAAVFFFFLFLFFLLLFFSISLMQYLRLIFCSTPLCSCSCETGFSP